MSFCSSNACMETYAPLVNAMIGNALFHSSTHINQILPQIFHFLRLCLIDILPQIL